MATLVLSAAGSALGGPVGGAAGAIVGRQIDRSLAGRGPPRLSDLRVQTSQYGNQIPHILGRMRVAGVVIWATDLVPTSVVGKSSSRDSYSVSFALALSSGIVSSVTRIWADGRLIRDASGRQAVAFALRLHHGDEDQEPDELIASIGGEEHTTAYRGLAYLVFEDLDLSSFGNRLPQLTVEVVAEGGLPSLPSERLVARCLGFEPTSEASAELVGYACSGDSNREAIEPYLALAEPNFRFTQVGWGAGGQLAVHHLEPQLWKCRGEDASEIDVRNEAELPTRVSVRFFDPSLDFAGGEQSAGLPGVMRLERHEVPATLSSVKGQLLAQRRLASAWSKRTSLWLTLPLSFFGIRLGDVVRGSASAGNYAVAELRYLRGGVLVRLETSPSKLETSNPEPGPPEADQSIIIEPAHLTLLELPGDRAGSQPIIAMAVCGGLQPYHSRPVLVSSAGSTEQIMSAPQAGVAGVLTRRLEPSPSELVDRRNEVEVEFVKDPVLTNCDAEALLAGANLLCVGGELLQFGTAERIGERRYRLRHLLRGRFGSDRREPHAADSPVVVLRPGSFVELQVPVERIGATVSAEMLLPDGTAAQTQVNTQGLAVRPLAPVHASWREVGNAMKISWVQRSRKGIPWLDHVDAPSDASQDRYRVSLSTAGGTTEQIVSETEATFGPELLQALGARPWRLEVRQVGDYSVSPPLTCSIV